MSARIVVTGAGGRLGAALVREWKAAGEDVIGFGRGELDLGKPRQLRDVLQKLDFGVLVNCAAQTNVDRCETHPDEAMRINAQAVRELACEQVRSRILMRRVGQTEEVAHALWYLSTRYADYISGQVLNVDGGFKMY